MSVVGLHLLSGWGRCNSVEVSMSKTPPPYRHHRQRFCLFSLIKSTRGASPPDSLPIFVGLAKTVPRLLDQGPSHAVVVPYHRDLQKYVFIKDSIDLGMNCLKFRASHLPEISLTTNNYASNMPAYKWVNTLGKLNATLGFAVIDFCNTSLHPIVSVSSGRPWY